jgi:hypothetical protein
MAVEFTFDAIRNRVLANLRSQEEWKDILYHSTNLRLIDAFAKELQYVANYGDILAYETNWNLALNTSSLLAQVDFFNYTPYRKIGATGTIRLSTVSTFDSTYPLEIQIPKYTVFSNGNDIYYCTIADEILFTDQTYIDVDVVQGIPRSFEYTASGLPYESIFVENDSLENVVFDFNVNGVEWDTIDNIRLADDGDDLVYTIKNKIDFSGVIIRTGNDYFGKKLVSGDSIVFNYVETLGSDGNVLSTGLITTVESTLTDSMGTEVTMYCTNTDALSGGQDYEELESIRANAPRFYQTGDRAIGLIDYQVILEAYSYITKANAWGETEYNIDNGNPVGTYIAPEENVIHVVGLTTASGSITSAQQTTIRDDINLFKPPTDIIQFEETLITYLIFNTTAYISDRSYTGSQVRQNIEDALEARYTASLMDFKDNLYFSDYISLIDQVTGVDHHTTTVDIYVLKSFSTAYEADISPYIQNITASTAYVYIKDTMSSTYTLIATDDGSGGWNFEVGYTGGGSIVYATGEANIIVTSGLTATYGDYTLKLEFEIDDDDVLLTKRNQIALYGESNITTSYMTV